MPKDLQVNTKKGPPAICGNSRVRIFEKSQYFWKPYIYEVPQRADFGLARTDYMELDLYMDFRVQAHQVARALNVPSRTVRYWAQKGIIPAIKKGPKIWYFTSDFAQHAGHVSSPDSRRHSLSIKEAARINRDKAAGKL